MEWRRLWSDVSISNKLSKVSDQAALLWTWMNPHADDWGMLQGEAGYILAKVVPRRRWTEAKVESYLKELIEVGLIRVRLGVIGCDARFLQISDFLERQPPGQGKHRKKSKLYDNSREVQSGVIEVQSGVIGCIEEKRREEKRIPPKPPQGELENGKGCKNKEAKKRHSKSKISDSKIIFETWKKHHPEIQTNFESVDDLIKTEMKKTGFNSTQIIQAIENYHEACRKKSWNGSEWTFCAWNFETFMSREKTGLRKFVNPEENIDSKNNENAEKLASEILASISDKNEKPEPISKLAKKTLQSGAVNLAEIRKLHSQSPAMARLKLIKICQEIARAGL